MAHEVTNIALNNGVEMPSIGLGVFPMALLLVLQSGFVT